MNCKTIVVFIRAVFGPFSFLPIELNKSPLVAKQMDQVVLYHYIIDEGMVIEEVSNLDHFDLRSSKVNDMVV